MNNVFYTEIPIWQPNISRRLTTVSNDQCGDYHPMLVIQINHGSHVTLGFARGRIDNYAVFVHLHKPMNPFENNLEEAPLMYDYQLLGYFQGLSKKYNLKDTIIRDFVQVYLHTNTTLLPHYDWVFAHLATMAKHYPKYLLVPLYIAILHLAMTSEFQYQRMTHHGLKTTYLGKKIKFVGFYQAVVQDKDTRWVAKFSRHMPHQKINHYYYQYAYRTEYFLKTGQWKKLEVSD